MANRTARQEEREVIADFLKLYKELPCLWDVESEHYKDRTRRNQAWEILASKLRELEPEANTVTAKKKVDCLRTTYQREAKKVEMSKRMRSGSKGIYTPRLWYFNKLRFIDKKEDNCSSGVDTLISDEEQETLTNEKHIVSGNRRPMLASVRDSKRFKLYETARQLLQHEDSTNNPFGTYIGEQLEQVGTFQRQVAEKLISDIIFLARTRRLNLDSKIETSSKSSETYSMRSHDSRSPTPHYL